MLERVLDSMRCATHTAAHLGQHWRTARQGTSVPCHACLSPASQALLSQALPQRSSPGESGSCGCVRAKRSSCSLPCSSLALTAPVGVPAARMDAGEEQPLPAALLLMGLSAPGRLPGVAGRLLGLLCNVPCGVRW